MALLSFSCYISQLSALIKSNLNEKKNVEIKLWNLIQNFERRRCSYYLSTGLALFSDLSMAQLFIPLPSYLIDLRLLINNLNGFH